MKAWSATTTPPIDCCTNFWTRKLSMPWAARISLYDRIKKRHGSFATTYVLLLCDDFDFRSRSAKFLHSSIWWSSAGGAYLAGLIVSVPKEWLSLEELSRFFLLSSRRHTKDTQSDRETDREVGFRTKDFLWTWCFHLWNFQKWFTYVPRNNLVNSELTPLLKYQCLPFHPQEDHAKAGKLFPRWFWALLFFEFFSLF